MNDLDAPGRSDDQGIQKVDKESCLQNSWHRDEAVMVFFGIWDRLEITIDDIVAVISNERLVQFVSSKEGVDAFSLHLQLIPSLGQRSFHFGQTSPLPDPPSFSANHSHPRFS